MVLIEAFGLEWVVGNATDFTMHYFRRLRAAGTFGVPATICVHTEPGQEGSCLIVEACHPGS
jgi:hypothetical protein